MILIKVLSSTEIRTLDDLGNKLTWNKNKMEQARIQLICHFCRETFFDNSPLHPPVPTHTQEDYTQFRQPSCVMQSVWKLYYSDPPARLSCWVVNALKHLLFSFFCEQTVFSQSQLITSNASLILCRHVEPKHLQLIIIIIF